jgi:hypothetical protein
MLPTGGTTGTEFSITRVLTGTPLPAGRFNTSTGRLAPVSQNFNPMSVREVTFRGGDGSDTFINKTSLRSTVDGGQVVLAERGAGEERAEHRLAHVHRVELAA